MVRRIFYTTNGSDPTTGSTEYVTPIPFAAGTYKAIAEEFGMLSATTTVVFVSTDWTPANITTALWLDASDSSTIIKNGSNLVSQWNDKSGNGRNATTTNSPTLTGSNMVFSPSNYMSGSMTSGALSDGLSCIVLFKKTGDIQTYEAHPFNRTTTSIANPLDYWRDQVYVGNGATFGLYFLADIAAQTTQCILATAINPTNINQYKNGIVITETPIANQYQDSSSTYQIATRGDLATKFTGEISEVVLCNGIMGTEIRQKIEGYLAWKWDGVNGNTALVTALHSDHPYKTHKPTV